MIGDCDLVNSCKFALGVLVKRFGNVREFLKKWHFWSCFSRTGLSLHIFNSVSFLRVEFFPSLARAKCHGSFCKHLVLSWLPGVRKQHLNAHLFRNDSVLSLASCYAEEELGAKHPKLLHHAHAVWLKRSKSARPQTAAKLQNCGVDAKP